MRINIFTICFLFIVGSINAAEMASNKMNAKTASLLEKVSKYNELKNSSIKVNEVKYPYSMKNNQLFINLLVQVNNSEAEIKMKELGCEVIFHTKTIYSIKAPINVIENLASLNSINAIEASQSYKVNLDSSKKAINGENVKATNANLPNIIGGEGVLIGIVDTGIDIAHPDFINENGTRILKLWDMSDTNNTGPDGYENFKWGKEYSKSDIDKNDGTVKQVDIIGHGTHVAGIAAGGGKADANFRGIAYSSDILFVKAARDDYEAAALDADIIAACQYLINEANKIGRPIVINLSLGNSLGSHDGKSLLSLAITELSKPGAVFSVAAGNDNMIPFHTGTKAEANTLLEFPIYPNSICWTVPSEVELCSTPNIFCTFAEFWYSKDLIDSVFVLAYNKEEQNNENPILISYKSYTIGSNISNDALFNEDGAPIALINYYSSVTEYTANNSGNLKIEIHNNGDTNIYIDKYLWSIVIKTKNPGQIDLWGSYPISQVRKFKSIWNTQVQRSINSMKIASPGDADSVICVGAFTTKNSWTDINNNPVSYDWIMSEISNFSSRGPSRDGRILPLITAPGNIIFSSLSKDSNQDSSLIMKGGKYVAMNGTSMATPHVTGAIALMLQVKPDLGYSEIYDVIANTAKKDEFTTSERNNMFGFGKIDIQAAIDYLMAKSGVDYIYANDVKVYPNPAINTVCFELNNGFISDNIQIHIYNSAGEKVHDDIKYDVSGNKLTLNISSLSSGVYSTECLSGKSIAKFRFVVK